MRRWAPLNEKQLDLLKRVDASEDLSGPEHARLRHSANAVRDRGLITLSRRGGMWRAELTRAGRCYLDHGHHPDDPRHRNEPAAPTPTRARRRERKPAPPNKADKAVTGSSANTTPRAAPHTTVLTTQQRQAEASELIERLRANNPVVIKAPDEHDIARWRKVVDFAKRHNLVPAGHRIEKTRRWNGDLHIRLHSGSHANTKHDPSGSPTVPVPESLRSPHPVVAELRDDRGRLVMPKELRRRCLLILQGLAAEATERGHGIATRPVPEHHGFRSSHRPHHSRRDGEISLVVNDFSYPVTIQQLSPKSDDPDKTRRLVIEISSSGSAGRQHRWMDGKVRRAEDGLGALLHEAETRAAEDHQRRIDEERAKAEREVRWEQAMRHAHQRAIEAHHAKALEAQVKRWRRAEELRAFRDELEQRLANPRSTDGDLTSAREWLEWINDHIKREDPLEQPPAMPATPRLGPEDLAPHLDGWSPHGPEAHLHSWRRGW